MGDRGAQLIANLPADEGEGCADAACARAKATMASVRKNFASRGDGKDGRGIGTWAPRALISRTSEDRKTAYHITGRLDPEHEFEPTVLHYEIFS